MLTTFLYSCRPFVQRSVWRPEKQLMKLCHSRGHIAWVNVVAPTFIPFLDTFSKKAETVWFLPISKPPPSSSYLYVTPFVKICQQSRWWYHQLADWHFLKLFWCSQFRWRWPSISYIHTINHKKLRPRLHRNMSKKCFIFLDYRYHIS